MVQRGWLTLFSGEEHRTKVTKEVWACLVEQYGDPRGAFKPQDMTKSVAAERADKDKVLKDIVQAGGGRTPGVGVRRGL